MLRLLGPEGPGEADSPSGEPKAVPPISTCSASVACFSPSQPTGATASQRSVGVHRPGVPTGSQAGVAPSPHHPCSQKSLAPHFPPAPRCPSLRTGLPASTLASLQIHSPSSSKKECFRGSQITHWSVYNLPVVFHFSGNKITSLRCARCSPLPRESGILPSFTPGSHPLLPTGGHRPPPPPSPATTPPGPAGLS